MDKITQILENVVRYKYFEVGVHIKNPLKNSFEDVWSKYSGHWREDVQQPTQPNLHHCHSSQSRMAKWNSQTQTIIIWNLKEIKVRSLTTWKLYYCNVCNRFFQTSTDISTRMHTDHRCGAILQNIMKWANLKHGCETPLSIITHRRGRLFKLPSNMP